MIPQLGTNNGSDHERFLALEKAMATLAQAVQDLVLDQRSAIKDLVRSIENQTNTLVSTLSGKNVIDKDVMVLICKIFGWVIAGLITVIIGILVGIKQGLIERVIG